VEETVKVLQDKIVLKKKEQYKLYAERKLKELREGIKYPFYTFQDDEYANFVTQVLHCL
jgi:hypothetical protein